MPDELSQVLDTTAVTHLASAPSYERGLAYLEAGRVGPLRASVGRVGATVQGSEDYLVELRAEGGELRFSCSCPIGREGAFCKHCVAVGLAWLGERGDPTPTLDDARAHLETLPQSELVELLIDHAHDDESLARKLLLRTATPTSGTGTDVASLRVLIEQAFVYREFVPYREVWGYVRSVEEAVDVLEAQLEQGRGGDIVELAEHALKLAERALDHIDDSDGQMGDLIARIEELHLDACGRRGQIQRRSRSASSPGSSTAPGTCSTKPSSATPRCSGTSASRATASWPRRRGRRCRSSLPARTRANATALAFGSRGSCKPSRRAPETSPI